MNRERKIKQRKRENRRDWIICSLIVLIGGLSIKPIVYAMILLDNKIIGG